VHFQLAQLIVNNGGIAALIELINTSKSASRLPAIMALGYIAGYCDQLALAVIGSKVQINSSKSNAQFFSPEILDYTLQSYWITTAERNNKISY